ncbi:MAG TPA: hypothetical protein P5232_03325 [Candidatus Moranbacteria bacterium]|nr:hypothetical protein [Candidatus Moranbacteria bacterium]
MENANINYLQENKIEARGKEIHEKELNEKLEMIQFIYADEQYQKEIEKELAPTSFYDILERDTGVISKIKDEHERILKDDDQIAEDLGKIKNKINEIYARKNEDWKKEIVQFLGSIHERFNRKEDEKNVKKAGIFIYNIIKSRPDLIKHGIGEGGDVLEIHLEKMYKQEGQNFTSQSIKKSFIELAEMIAEKHLGVSDLAARSWILDSGLVEAFGFEEVERTDSLNHFSTWWQFIDKNGQIDKKRFEQFTKNGKPPLQVVLAKVKVEDFLKKYLPQEKKGKILLKEYSFKNKEALEFRKMFETKFNSIKPEEIADLFSESRVYSEFYQKGIFNELIEFLVEMKKKGYTYRQIENMKSERLNVISEKLKKVLDANNYVEKEIFIP